MIRSDNKKLDNVPQYDLVYLDLLDKRVYYNHSKRSKEFIFVNDGSNSILKLHDNKHGSVRNYGIGFEKVLY